MPKKNKARDVDKITGQKKNYKVLEAATKGDESPPWYACDRKRCLNGRCGVCWLVILGLGLAVGISCILIFSNALGFTFSTDGNETLYELICTDCTLEPTYNPTVTPTADPTSAPTVSPTEDPTEDPSKAPTEEPTISPTGDPTMEPSGVPSVEPTLTPTADPTYLPTVEPSNDPTVEPTFYPTVPTPEPTSEPSVEPTLPPTADPTLEPTLAPSYDPTTEPTLSPTAPTSEPTSAPTVEPTVDPTVDPTVLTNEPTGDPTAERRMDLKSYTTPNVLLLIANGTGNFEFRTPQVENFLKEGYTFKNLTKKHCLNNLISGRTVMQKAFSWVQQLRSKGYTNHYYGKWLFGTSMEASNFDGRGWHTYRAINSHQDQILDEVKTAIRMFREERWTITVGLNKSDAYTGFHHHSKNATIYEICSRYFQEKSPEYNHDLGVSCQRSMKSDEKIGEVVQSLRSTGDWERTIVMLVITGDQENMFSVSGGALPAKLLRTINKDLHSFLDIVPTILSVAGFTDSQVRLAKLDGSPLISLKQSTAGSF